MKWNKLLAEKRFRDRDEKDSLDARSAFEDDFSRIVFSSAFRRLQDKTQVFPLERDSLVRTRLTHSFEVSNIGRSLGLSIERELIKNEKLNEKKYRSFIPSIVAAAGLIHDLGNPPFGHYGEDSFKNFYSSKIGELKDIGFNDVQIKDLTKFDGNVQTFRYLTKLQLLKDEYSYNLSFPTLATIVKYPCSSETGNKPNGNNICKKKYGYFTTEEEKFRKIWNYLDIPDMARFPLTFILEAADDIAYSANDLEDGVRKSIINSKIVLEKMQDYIKTNSANMNNDDLLYRVFDKCTDIRKKDDTKIENCIIEQFRIAAQGEMIKSVVETFTNDKNYKEIMEGNFSFELLKKSKAKNIRNFFSTLANKEVFSCNDVLKLELMGEEVIKGLLEKFYIIVCANPSDLKETKKKEGKIYKLISENLRYVYENYTPKGKFDRILLINDYICGMTDSYALQTYRKLTGIEL
jgi:dGTPase